MVPKNTELPCTASAEEQSPDALLEVIDLAVSFQRANGRVHPAVQGVNLIVYPRQTVAMVGESGCGKTVTALSILRLIPSPPGRIDRGSIMFQGRDLLALPQDDMLEVRGGRIAMVFQEPMTSLNPVFTIGEQIVEAIELHQRVRRRRAVQIAVDALKEVGISDAKARLNAYPHQFSGGMRQRVMIAMALACRPKLLLADEITTALDVTIQAQILRLLQRIQHARDMGVILITHDLGLVAQYADVVCVMYAGRVMEYATVFDLFDEPLHPYTRGLLNCKPRFMEKRNRLRTIDDVMMDSDLQAVNQRTGRRFTPWWPGRDTEATYQLGEIAPGHWVACRSDDSAVARDACRPDLSFRRAQAG